MLIVEVFYADLDDWLEVGWYWPRERRLARRQWQRLEYRDGSVARIRKE